MRAAGRGRRAARWVSLAAGFAASFLLAGWVVLHALDAADIPYRQIDLDVSVRLNQQLEAIAAGPREETRIMFLGDSLVMDVLPPDTSVPARLAWMIGANRGRPLRLRRVISSGVGSFSHYMLSENVARTQPDVVVMSLNLRWFSREVWYHHERAGLVGWLPASRWLEAAELPLHQIGVSADLAIFYRMLVKLGAIELWQQLRREQVRVARAYWALADRMEEWGGTVSKMSWRHAHILRAKQAATRGDRITEKEAHRELDDVFGGVRPDHPTMRMLDAVLRRLCGDGVQCIVYVAPINVEFLAQLGVLDAEGLERTLAAIESMVQSHHAVFVDLHDILPDAAFVDYLDHIRPKEKLDSTGLVARRLAPYVRQAVRAHRAAGRHPAPDPPQRRER